MRVIPVIPHPRAVIPTSPRAHRDHAGMTFPGLEKFVEENRVYLGHEFV
ncbi:hypothetical protein [Deinococcus geothermalis]|nr:hypothetical protein [Deinococcus geothermalis]